LQIYKTRYSANSTS